MISDGCKYTARLFEQIARIERRFPELARI